ncbi:MAG: GNAT family N-acetyltransferase [Pleurocapsa sp. MO_226.B13]|nr:GNAT family N-acetyltransferase [Pleurocapsa sp. MO_226.B13]
MLEIKPIEEHQIEQAKQVVLTVCLEIWQGEISEADFKRIDPMSDINHVQSHYFDNRGLFLVLADGDRVVGTGAIRQLEPKICELKRMWFLKPYRGRGLGKKMTQILFDFAKKQEYKKVRLDLASKERQPQAVRFYQKLGFYPIDRYNNSPCTVFMEKVL